MAAGVYGSGRRGWGGPDRHGTVVTLPIISELALVRAVDDVGSIGILRRGASTSLVVNGTTVTEAVASNRSSWMTRTGRGLPVWTPRADGHRVDEGLVVGLVLAGGDQRRLSMRLPAKFKCIDVGNHDLNWPQALSAQRLAPSA